MVFTLPLPDDPEDPLGLNLVYSVVGGNVTASDFYLQGRNVIEAPGAVLDFETPSRKAFLMVCRSPAGGARRDAVCVPMRSCGPGILFGWVGMVRSMAAVQRTPCAYPANVVALMSPLSSLFPPWMAMACRGCVSGRGAIPFPAPRSLPSSHDPCA